MDPPDSAPRGLPRQPRGSPVLAGSLPFSVALPLHDDLIGVVRESVDSTLGKDRVVKEGYPLVNGPVAGENGRGTAMALKDDFVEVAGLTGVETAKREVIDDKDVRSKQAPQYLLGGVVGARVVEELEEVIGTQEEDVVVGPTRGMTEGGGQESLPHSDGSEEDHILLTFDEAQGEEIADAVPVEGDGSVPVEALEGLFFLKSSAAQTHSQVLLVSAIDLVLQDELEEIDFREFHLSGVGYAIGQGRQKAREFQAFHDALEGLLDLHDSPPGWVDR